MTGMQDATDAARVRYLEDIQRATLNMLEDLHGERERLEQMQRATYNILDDLSVERERFEEIQRATFNILEDLMTENDRVESTHRATLNVLEDFNDEREKVVASLAEKEILLRDVASLAEKEVLLREIHHRVKNNLQVIASLLSLQSGYLHDPEAQRAFTESRNRVKSMALVHETLYQSKDLGRLDFAEYVERLSSDLFLSFGISAERVHLAMDVVSGVLPVDVAVPCGLILCELVSNSLKHAFPDGRSGHVTISFKPVEGEMWTLSVADDGIGVEAGLDLKKAKTLGLRLVDNLASQVGGKVKVESNGGARFTVTFRVPSKSRESAIRAKAA